MSPERPILRIDLGDPTPAYRQIADGLRALLVDGALKAGERLPPVRRLAGDLGVHHNTVAQAYRLLAEEGWLALVQGRGAEVTDRRRPRAGSEDRRRFRRRLEALVSQALADGAARHWVASQLETVARETAPGEEVTP